MRTENAVSIEIPQTDVQTVKNALTIIQDTLSPYVIALTPEQRKTIPKMSVGTEPFVSKVMDYTTSDPQFAPTYMDVQEMQKDFDIVSDLTPLLRAVDQLTANLSDTTMLAGSEAYLAALTYYNSVKMATKVNIPGAKAIYEDLRKRFEGQGKSKP
ncbi:MAG: hypothetical protein OCD76_21595 [Reichenbachiella sp.]